MNRAIQCLFGLLVVWRQVPDAPISKAILSTFTASGRSREQYGAFFTSSLLGERSTIYQSPGMRLSVEVGLSRASDLVSAGRAFLIRTDGITRSLISKFSSAKPYHIFRRSTTPLPTWNLSLAFAITKPHRTQRNRHTASHRFAGLLSARLVR